MIKLSQTIVQSFKDCPQLYKYMLEWKLRKEPTFFIMGTAFHAGLEAFYGGGNAIKAVKAVFDKQNKSTFTEYELAQFEKDETTVQAMLAGYMKLYKRDEFKVKAVEQEFQLPFKNVKFTGKIDMVVERDGGLWIVEHKTTSGIDKNYLDRTHIDAQVLTYILGCFHLFKKFPKGIIYNAVRKPEIRQKQMETSEEFQMRLIADYFSRPDFYFAREEILISFSQIKQFVRELQFIIRQIIKAHKLFNEGKEEAFYMNSGHCINKYGRCQFMDACLNGRRPDIIRYTKKS